MSDATALVAGPPVPDGPTAAGVPDRRSASPACPFLLAADGDWRSALPAREHRCTAVDPPASLSLEKQRRLCLEPSHRTCATYLAARQAARRAAEGEPAEAAAEAEESPAHEDESGPREPALVRWALPRTAPVVLDRGRPSIRAVLVHRSVAQVGLVVLMALAFLVLALARLSAGDTGAGPLASPSAAVASNAGAPSPMPSASPRPATSPAPRASPSPAASRAPSPSPVASAGTRTYRVVAGDTLSGIAARFHVTVAALQAANGIKDPSLIKVGTVLVIP